MNKLQNINRYVRFTLNKLAGIRRDLVRADNNWQNWEFPKMIKALRKWTERNPAILDQRRELPKKDRLLQARQGQQRENASTVEAKVTESLIATNLKAYLKEEKL